MFRFSPLVVESGKFLLVESGIPLTTGCGTQVPLTKNLECTAWNPESKTVLDSLTSDDSLFRDADVQIVCHVANSPSMSQDHESSLASMLERHGIFLKLGRNLIWKVVINITFFRLPLLCGYARLFRLLYFGLNEKPPFFFFKHLVVATVNSWPNGG